MLIKLNSTDRSTVNEEYEKFINNLSNTMTIDSHQKSTQDKEIEHSYSFDNVEYASRSLAYMDKENINMNNQT